MNRKVYNSSVIFYRGIVGIPVLGADEVALSEVVVLASSIISGARLSWVV